MIFATIDIHLKNGQIYGCSSVCSSRKLNLSTKEYEPAIAFICSQIPQVELLSDIEKVTVSSNTWCPTCK